MKSEKRIKASKATIVLPSDLAVTEPALHALVVDFATTCDPLERSTGLYVLRDVRTGATFCECHIQGSKFVALGTTNVPLDPEDQPDYRANREILADHAAFEKMKDDALQKRTFSNIVAEYTTHYDEEHPIKIIGGQHRFEAIKLALAADIDEAHGLKMYFNLNSAQRLDVQLISNTNMAVSRDLYDRMHETVAGKHLREWSQGVGLLDAGKDFADKRQRGSQMSVRVARTFIINYYKGKTIDALKFADTDTTPLIAETGTDGDDWNTTKQEHPDLWIDEGLRTAGTEFAQLIKAQRAACTKENGRAEHADRTLNLALIAAWAYVAGLLSANSQRLQRHFSLRTAVGKDPVNGAVLAKGRHKTDPENYRGLGNRSNSKECGRFAELFFAQAEKADGITKTLVDLAIARYHAKQAKLEADRFQKRVDDE